MEKKLMRIGWITFLFMLVLFLVACSEDVSNDSANASNDGETSEGSESSSDGALSGTLEIQYFVGGYGDEWWKEVISGFQSEHPDLEIIEQSGPDINTEMNTRWISNNPPDVVYLDGSGASETQMIKDGQLLDLSDWAKELELEDGTPLLDGFISPPDELAGGEIYSLPLVFDTWGVWYDSEWFAQEGWEEPSDFDSWVDSMKQIKEDTGIAPLITTGQYPQYFQRGVLYPAFAAAGGAELLNDLSDGKVEAWESPEALEVIKKVEEIVTAGLMDEGFAARSHTQTQMNFLLHQNAYIPVGFWLPTEMENDTPDDLEYGFVPTPMNDAGEAMALVPDIRPVAIAQEAKNPEAAKAFIEYIFTFENANKFAESTGAIMNLAGVDLADNENVPEFLKGVNEMINNPGLIEVHSRTTPEGEEQEIAIETTSEIHIQIVEILMGNITAEEFVDNMIKSSKDLRE